MEQPKINIDLSQTTELICDECQGKIFTEGVMIRKVSRFIVGSTKDTMVPVGVFYCVKCGHVNEDMLPVELRTPKP